MPIQPDNLQFSKAVTLARFAASQRSLVADPIYPFSPAECLQRAVQAEQLLRRLADQLLEVA